MIEKKNFNAIVFNDQEFSYLTREAEKYRLSVREYLLLLSLSSDRKLIDNRSTNKNADVDS
jgi:hypothetical protein